MNVTLQNTGRFGFWVTLSDGRSIDLSPRTQPVSVSARELKVNRSLKKLMDRGLVQKIKVPPKKKPPKKTAKKAANKKAAKPKQ